MSKPIIPWIGGKRRLAKHILPLINGHKCYVEPFAGAAAIFFMKEPSKTEVINDINSDLHNLYQVVKYHLDELINHFHWALVSREEWLTKQRVDPTTLTDIQRAARFYDLQKPVFGGKVVGQNFGTAPSSPPRFNRQRIEEDLGAANSRLSRTWIENLPWQECVRRYDRDYTIFYMDPPYWKTEGYGVDFGWEQYEQIAELARTIKGRMVISHVDQPEIRELFSGFTIKEIPINYTIGGGKAARTELIIKNW